MRLIVLIVLCLSSIVLGQRAGTARSLPASRRPTTIPTTRPAAKKLALKPGAPAEVKEWFDKLPEYREKYKATAAGRLNAQIASLTKQRESLSKQSIPTVYVGKAGSESNTKAISERRNEMAQIGKKLGLLRRELKDLQASNNENFIGVEQFTGQKLEVGAYGQFATPLTILQVIGDSTAIAKYGETSVWLEGIDTSKTVDGEKIEYDEPFIVPRTKRYETASGSNTVYVIRPFNIKEWIYYDDGTTRPVATTQGSDDTLHEGMTLAKVKALYGKRVVEERHWPVEDFDGKETMFGVLKVSVDGEEFPLLVHLKDGVVVSWKQGK